MTTKSKYQDLRTLEDLEAAIRDIHARIESGGQAVSNSFNQLQTFYTPRNLAYRTAQKYALDNHLYRIGINVVRGLKKLLR